MLRFEALVTENTDEGMFGRWVMPSGKIIYFGCPQWNYDQSDISSIAYGVHTFHLVKSTKRSLAAGHDVFVYQQYDSTPNDGIDDLNERVAVQIHIGNYCGTVSKGFKTDVQGCFILGMALGRDAKTNQRMVIRSGDAFALFMAETKGEPIEVEFMAA